MKKIISLLLLLLVIFFLVKTWWDSQLSSVSADNSKKVIVIAKGAGVSEIAKKLKDENLIKSELVFKIYVKQNNLTNKLQAGSYKLSPSMSVVDLLGLLQKGSEDSWVTFLEGWRIEEMANEINSKFPASRGEQIPDSKFLELAKEGYMFPDTYLFPKEITGEQIVKKLTDTFNLKFTPELKAEIRKQGLTEEEGVILASIVEREARSDGARKMVASILLKRFKIGMGLNADATIQYALVPKGSKNPPAGGWWKRHLSREDLKIDSPFNTYIHRGLPPAPIANPSLSSLKAVAEADSSTPYLYYYHDSKGVSHYGKNLEEHNQNIASYP